jgi:hypothetical protein
MPSSHWRRCRCCASIFANCRRHPPPLPSSMPPSNAAVNRGRHPPPPQSNYISLSPSPHRSPLPLSNAATLPPPLNVPATTTPSAVAGRSCRRPPPPPGHHLHHHHRHLRCPTHCHPLPKKEATSAPPPEYQRQHQRENVYKF